MASQRPRRPIRRQTKRCGGCSSAHRASAPSQSSFIRVGCLSAFTRWLPAGKTPLPTATVLSLLRLGDPGGRADKDLHTGSGAGLESHRSWFTCWDQRRIFPTGSAQNRDDNCVLQLRDHPARPPGRSHRARTRTRTRSCSLFPVPGPPSGWAAAPLFRLQRK